jgi:hypothetical protein
MNFLVFYLFVSYYTLVTSDTKDRKPFNDIETFGDILWSVAIFPAHSIKILTGLMLDKLNTLYIYFRGKF